MGVAMQNKAKSRGRGALGIDNGLGIDDLRSRSNTTTQQGGRRPGGSMRAQPGEENDGIPGFFVYIAGRADAYCFVREKRNAQDEVVKAKGLVPCPGRGGAKCKE